MDRWLKFEIEFCRWSRKITVSLYEYTKTDNSRWPNKEKVDSKVISLRLCSLFFMSIPHLIAKTQNKMIERYSKRYMFDINLARLCDEYEGGKYVLEDRKTTCLLAKFKKVPDD